MRTPRFSGLAGWLGALGLVVLPALAQAQDGEPPVGPPVTAPKTNELDQRPGPLTPPIPTTTDDVLPPVPATASDPAPFGTNGVRVDTPQGDFAGPQGAAVRRQLPQGRTVPGPGMRALRGVRYVEGVVTKISKPPEGLPGGQVELTIDPTMAWEDYASQGGMVGIKSRREAQPNAKPADSADQPEGKDETIKEAPTPGDTIDTLLDPDRTPPADDAQAATEPATEENTDAEPGAEAEGTPPAQDQPETKVSERSRGVDVVVSGKSYIFTFARTPDGMDLYGHQNISAPAADPEFAARAQAGGPASRGPQPTNFTNIREGSYVAVRYRRIGDVNVALNLSLIELPLTMPGEIGAYGDVPVNPNVAPGTHPRGNPNLPGAAVPGAPLPGGSAPPAAGAPPVRVPHVPETPVTPGVIGRP